MAITRKRIIQIAVFVLLFLVFDVVAGYLILKVVIPRIYSAGQTSKEEKKKEEAKKAEEEAPPVQKALAPINLNPSQSSGEILSTEIVLEAKDQAVIDEATLREAQIDDMLITYLSFKTVTELNDIAKRDQYKKEMLAAVNSVLKSGKMTGLYTKSWIIQFE